MRAVCRRLSISAVIRAGSEIRAVVAQRALEPGSKLAATGWVAEREAIEGLTEVSDDQAYRGMDFLLEAWRTSPVRWSPRSPTC